MSEFLRVYDAEACGADGYPFAWHRCPACYGIDRRPCPDCEGAGSIKDLIRALAEHRCARCLHPYVVGESGTWDNSLIPAPPIPQDHLPELPAGVLDGEGGRGRATNWSRCDGRCRHGGPMRVMCRQLDGGEAWEPFDPTPQACGPAVEAVAPAPAEAAWRILTVHHLNEVKADCRWWNLAALCQRCHLYIQRKVTMEQVWPFEHSEWFKPYAAGFYASSYLGEELTREQTMGRLDELLELERVA